MKIPRFEPSRQYRTWWIYSVLMVLNFLAVVSESARCQTSGLPENLQPLFAEGVEALKKGRLDTAEKNFIGVLEAGGKLAFVYNNLGAVYQQQRQHNKALAQFQEAIRLEPNYAAPHILSGLSLMAFGRTSEAVKELETAVKLQPDEAIPRVKLAQIYDQSDNFSGMIEQYQKLREISPNDPEFVYQLGKAYMRLAGWCSEEIEKINPGSARLHQSMANSYVQQGENERAIESLKRAIQADPKLPELHLALAQLYQQQGKVPEAVEQIDLELALVPNSLAALTMKESLRNKK